MKMHPVGAELFRADGQTDMTKLLVAFSNIAKPRNNKPIPWNRVIEKLTVA